MRELPPIGTLREGATVKMKRTPYLALAGVIVGSLILSACGSATDPITGTPAAAPLTLVAPTQAATLLPFATRPPFVLPDPPVLGGIDGVTGELKTGGKITVVGWAVDVTFGAPAARVEVIMNNKWTFSTKTGEPRPDITAALQRKDVNLAGWSAEIALGTLPPGEHTLGLLIFDVNGQPHQISATLPIVINDVAGAAVPDAAATAAPENACTLTGTLEKVEGTARPGWVVIASGWAADVVNNTPATKIVFLLDGKAALEVKLTLDRPDVAKALGQDGLLTTGFSGRVPLPDDLEEGTHTISAVAYDADGNSIELDKPIEIKVLPKL